MRQPPFSEVVTECGLDLRRVVVVGTRPSGKTTFARRLAGVLGSQHVELDALYWGPEWTPRPDFQGDVLAAVQYEHWVIDGNYTAVRDLIWRRCTAIVWLDYSFARVFAQAWEPHGTASRDRRAPLRR